MLDQPAVSGSGISAMCRVRNTNMLGPIVANQSGDLFLLCPCGLHVLWRYSERRLAVAACDAAVFEAESEDGVLAIGLVFGEAQGSLKFLSILIPCLPACLVPTKYFAADSCPWSECCRPDEVHAHQHPADHSQHYHRDQISSIIIEGQHVLVAGRDGHARVFQWALTHEAPQLVKQLSSPTTQFELAAFVSPQSVCTITGDRSVRLWPLKPSGGWSLSADDSQIVLKPSKQITCHDFISTPWQVIDAIVATGERTGCFHVAWLQGARCVASLAQAAAPTSGQTDRSTAGPTAEDLVTAIKLFSTSRDDIKLAVAQSGGAIQLFTLPQIPESQASTTQVNQLNPTCSFQTTHGSISRLCFVTQSLLWLGNRVGDLELWDVRKHPVAATNTSRHIMAIVELTVDHWHSSGWSASEDGTVHRWAFQSAHGPSEQPEGCPTGTVIPALKHIHCAIQHDSSTWQSTALAGVDLLIIWLQLLRFVFTRQLGFAFSAPLWWVCRCALSFEVDLYENHIAFFLTSFAPQGRSGAAVALLTAGAGLLGSALHLRSSRFWKVKQAGSGWARWLELFLTKQVLVTSLLYVVEELIKQTGSSFSQLLSLWVNITSTADSGSVDSMPEAVAVPQSAAAGWDEVRPYCSEGWVLTGIANLASSVPASVPWGEWGGSGGVMPVAWGQQDSLTPDLTFYTSPILAVVSGCILWLCVFLELRRAGAVAALLALLPSRLQRLLFAKKLSVQPQHRAPRQFAQRAVAPLVLGAASVLTSSLLILFSHNQVAHTVVTVFTLVPVLVTYCWVAFKVAVAGDVHELVFRSTGAMDWNCIRKRSKTRTKTNTTAPRNMFSPRTTQSMENLFWLMLLFAVLGCTINSFLPRVVETMQSVHRLCAEGSRPASCEAGQVWGPDIQHLDARLESIVVDEFVIVVCQLLNWLGCIAFVWGTIRHPPFYSHASNVTWLAMLLVLTFTHMNSMASWVQLVAAADYNSCLKLAFRGSGGLRSLLQVLESAVVFPVSLLQQLMRGSPLVASVVGLQASEWIAAVFLPFTVAACVYSVAILAGPLDTSTIAAGQPLLYRAMAGFRSKAAAWRQKWRHARMVPFIEVQLLYSDDNDVACSGVYRVMLLSREPSKRPLLCIAGAIDALSKFLQRRLQNSSERDGALVYAIAALGNLSSAECFAKVESSAGSGLSDASTLLLRSLTSCTFVQCTHSTTWEQLALKQGLHLRQLLSWNAGGDWRSMMQGEPSNWNAALMKPNKFPRPPTPGQIIALSPPTPAHEMESAHLGGVFAFFLLRRPSEASLLRYKLVAAMKNVSASSLPSKAYLQKELHDSGASLVLLAELRAIALRMCLPWFEAAAPGGKTAFELRQQQSACSQQSWGTQQSATLLTFLSADFTPRAASASLMGHSGFLFPAHEFNCYEPRTLSTPQHLLDAVTLLSNAAVLDARDLRVRVCSSPSGSSIVESPAPHDRLHFKEHAVPAQQNTQHGNRATLSWMSSSIAACCRHTEAQSSDQFEAQSAPSQEPSPGQLLRSSSTNPLYNPATAVDLPQNLIEMSSACAKQNIELFKSLLGRNCSRPLDNFQLLASGLVDSLCLVAQLGVCPATDLHMYLQRDLASAVDLDMSTTALNTMKFACYLACNSAHEAHAMYFAVNCGTQQIALEGEVFLAADLLLPLPLLAPSVDSHFVIPKLGYAWPVLLYERAIALDDAIHTTLQQWDAQCLHGVSLVPDWRCVTECHVHQMGLSASAWGGAGRSPSTLAPVYNQREVTPHTNEGCLDSEMWRCVTFVQRATIRLAVSRGMHRVACLALSPQAKRNIRRSTAFQRSACTILLTLMSEPSVRRCEALLEDTISSVTSLLWLATSRLPLAELSLSRPPFTETAEDVSPKLVAEVLELVGLLLSDAFVQQWLSEQHSACSRALPSLLGLLSALSYAADATQPRSTLLEIALAGAKHDLNACSVEGVNRLPEIVQELLQLAPTPRAPGAPECTPTDTTDVAQANTTPLPARYSPSFVERSHAGGGVVVVASSKPAAPSLPLPTAAASMPKRPVQAKQHRATKCVDSHHPAASHRGGTKRGRGSGDVAGSLTKSTVAETSAPKRRRSLRLHQTAP